MVVPVTTEPSGVERAGNKDVSTPVSELLLVFPVGQNHPGQQGRLGDEVQTGQPRREQNRAERVENGSGGQ